MTLFRSTVRRWARGVEPDAQVSATLAVRLAALCGAPITLVLLAVRRPPEEQGLYFILINAFALTGVFELGLSTVVVQFASHATVRAERLADYAFTTGDSTTEAIDSLLRVSNRWYSRAALLVLIGLFVLGVFIVWREPAATYQFIAAGLTVCVTAAIYISTTPLIAILEGGGDLISVQRMRLVQTVAGLTVVWTLIYFTNAFAAVAGFALTQLAVVIAWLISARLTVMKRALATMTAAWHRKPSSRDFSRIQTHALVTWIPPIIAGQAATVLALWYFGSAGAGRVGMGLTLATAPLTLGNAWLYARFPTMGRLAAQRSPTEVRRVGLTAMWQATAVCAAGAVGVTVLVAFMAALWPATEARVVSWPAVAAIGVYSIGNVAHLGLASLLRAHRRETLAIASAVASLGAIVGAVVGGWRATPEALCVGFSLLGAATNLALSVWMFERAWTSIAQAP